MNISTMINYLHIILDRDGDISWEQFVKQELNLNWKELYMKEPANLPRPIFEVIAAIITQLPKDDHLHRLDSLLEELNKIANGSFYTAPEDSAKDWRILNETLTHYLGKPNTDWKKTILCICQNTIDYRQFLNKYRVKTMPGNNQGEKTHE